jgi:hypothetical protein
MLSPSLDQIISNVNDLNALVGSEAKITVQKDGARRLTVRCCFDVLVLRPIESRLRAAYAVHEWHPALPGSISVL